MSLLKKAWLAFSFLALPIEAQTVTMPSVPTITAPSAPTVTEPSPVTLSTETSSLSSSQTKTTTSKSTNNTNLYSDMQENSQSSDSALSDLATSALQQLVTSGDTSSLLETPVTTSTTNPIPENIKSYGKILRCIVNNKNYCGAFKNYWFSKPEITGAFLFTGTYTPSPAMSEIFYMYFIPTDNKTYSVSITGDNINESLFSLLKKRIKSNNLTAKRTGNLVSLRTKDETLSMDMLLSIDFTLER